MESGMDTKGGRELEMHRRWVDDPLDLKMADEPGGQFA